MTFRMSPLLKAEELLGNGSRMGQIVYEKPDEVMQVTKQSNKQNENAGRIYTGHNKPRENSP